MAPDSPSPAHSPTPRQTANQAPPPIPTPMPARRWRGAVLAFLLLGAVIGAAWYLIHRPALPAAGGFAGRGQGAPGVAVGDALVQRADVPVYIDALGTVTPVATVTLQPQVSGVLTEVLFTEGQMVKKGQPLAHIDPRPFEQALLQAQGVRQRDEAQLANTRTTLSRYQTLLAQDSVARQDVDTQTTLVQQLEGTVMADRAAEQVAQLNLGFTRLVAPLSGRVGLRTVDAGNVVSPSTAGGIATITQMTPMDVLFSVPQDRVPALQARAHQAQLPVAALDRNRTQTLDSGVFATLDNQVDVQTGTVRAKARFANAAGGLFPNQFVNVRLQLDTLAGALVVPVTALRTGPNGDFVYVIQPDNTVAVRNVQRGPSTVEQIVITVGLHEGDRVVTEGGDRLKDGASVRLASDVPAPPKRPAPEPGQRRRGPAQ